MTPASTVRRASLACLPLLLSLIAGMTASLGHAEPNTPVQRGEYVANMAGCHSCHTGESSPAMAGGVVLDTPFGSFYPPNITSDPTYGIGTWSQAQFNQSMRHGIDPDGNPYYPSFPYTSYTRMTDQDLIDLKAYLDQLPAIAQATPDHDLGFPFNLRFGLHLWQWLNFTPTTFQPQANQSVSWNRGAYIVTGPGHCGECHTPRTLTMAVDTSSHLQGNKDGPDGTQVPGIDMSKLSEPWLLDDILFALQVGMTPEGDFFGGNMAEVVENTSLLTEDDQLAIATYLMNPNAKPQP
ncbi:MAG TPA: hypothetical protein DE179_13985 [Oceanospirillaceae bacterium]|nr:hypothetical protein [Oceanospirillaceae bacterium]